MVPHPQHKLEYLLGTRAQENTETERRQNDTARNAIATLDACIECLESILANWETKR
jgi:hypothetical protein